MSICLQSFGPGLDQFGSIRDIAQDQAVFRRMRKVSRAWSNRVRRCAVAQQTTLSFFPGAGPRRCYVLLTGLKRAGILICVYMYICL